MLAWATFFPKGVAKAERVQRLQFPAAQIGLNLNLDQIVNRRRWFCYKATLFLTTPNAVARKRDRRR